MSVVVLRSPSERNSMDNRMMTAKSRPHRAQSLEYILYSVLLFPFALAAVMVRRLSGSGTSYRTGRSKSFIGDVIELNRSTVPWVFMGR